MTPPRRGGSLRMQLVANALLGVTPSIALTGVITFFLLTYHLDIIETNFARSRDVLTNDIARSDLVARAASTAGQIDAFFISRIREAKAWATSSIVAEAAMSAHASHTSEGLTDSTVDEIENRFRIEKSLGLWPEADQFLRRQVAASPYFAEIFFTDRNGFNVALTNPTSDFVQSDEDWWQRAWSHGISVGEIDYDESAGVWSVDISIRIDGSESGTPLGVMKTVLAIEPVQKIADRAARAIAGGRAQIATGRGALIAETSSQHARERIMNPEVDLREHGAASVRASFGGERTGFAVDEDWLTGYARSGGRETYASTVSRFTGFDWIVILQRPITAVHEPITVLRAIEDALRDWRLMLALGLGAMALLSTALAAALALGSARRYAAALNAVSEAAERWARGERAGPPAVEGPDEIVRVNEAVHRLSRMVAGSPEWPRSR